MDIVININRIDHLYSNRELDMTTKFIKNEQWSVKLLVSRIQNKEIIKPKYQRKRKWSIQPDPKNDNLPNERKYIEFLFENKHSVHPITFGIEVNSLNTKYYSNIDGNNRINSVVHYLTEPFAIFPEYLDELIQFIKTTFTQPANIPDTIIKIFHTMTYTELMNFKFNKYFEQKGETELYNNYLKAKRDEFEYFIEPLQQKLKINGTDRFDNDVYINVTIFEGYTTDELCKLFEKINRYTSKLTEMELLTARLYNCTEFNITDKVFETKIRETLKTYYNHRNDEVLESYEFTDDDKINAFDFITAFQIIASNKCSLINDTASDITQNCKLSLFFKLYKTIYGGLDINKFSTENVNDFIAKINQTINILNRLYSQFTTDKLTATAKIFEGCSRKIESLSINNLYCIMTSIISSINNSIPEPAIIKSVEKCILYHLLCEEINDKAIRNQFKEYDILTTPGSGAFIDNLVNKISLNPAKISSDITRERMNNVIDHLIRENNKPIPLANKPKTRRNRKFWEKTLIYYLYKIRVPIKYLDENRFWLEHIVPFSSSYTGTLDIERLGNVIPIIDILNNKRGNKHIGEYATIDTTGFMRYINDIMPDNIRYDGMVNHPHGTNTPPTITNPDAYNAICNANEIIYKNTFLNQLF